MPSFDRMVARDDLTKVAGELDYLVVLTPLTPETHHIINAKLLSAMKPTAYLINMARGGMADEAAVMKALESGEIAGSVLDVFDDAFRPVARHPALCALR